MDDRNALCKCCARVQRTDGKRKQQHTYPRQYHLLYSVHQRRTWHNAGEMIVEGREQMTWAEVVEMHQGSARLLRKRH